MHSSRRRLMLIAFVMLAIVCQAIAQFSVTMPYKPVTVQNVNGTASFSGAPLSGNPGQPALPAYTVTFLLPPEADLTTVTTTISNPTEQELSGQYNVDPVKPIPGLDGKVKWPQGMDIVDGKDMSIYKKSAFYRSEYKGTSHTGMMQQYKLVDVQISPYKYNPVTKKLKVITGGTLTVNFKSGISGAAMSRRADVENVLMQNVVNQSVIEYYGTAPTSQLMLKSAKTYALAASEASTAAATAAASVSGNLYLILTTDAIVNSTPALATYKSMLEQKGATVEIATEGSWLNAGSTGQQRCEDIRLCIQRTAYNARFGPQLKYVLLIGNPDPTTGDVPMKNWTAIADAYAWPNGIPTDYYYADLSSDWVLNGPDKYSEVAVGRIPVYGNVSVVNAYLTKAIAYQNASGDAVEWRRTYLGLAEILGFSPESYEQSENIVTAIRSKGWNVKRLYGSYSIFASGTNFSLLPPVINLNPLPDNIMMNVGVTAKMWNYEAPGFVFVGGHGFPGGVANVLQSGPLGDAYPENVSQLNTTYPSAVTASSCATSDPLEPNNCGAVMIFKNAISYTGYSTEVYDPGANTVPYSIAVLQNATFGDALVSSKIADNTSRTIEHCLQFNLYGCPEASLNLQTIDTTLIPKNFKVATSTSTLGFDVTWSAVPGATQYRIERSDVHSGAKINGFTQVGTTASGVLKFTDGNIATGICYKYRVCAINSGNVRGPYSLIDSTTNFGPRGPDLSCPVPSNLSVNSVQSNLVNLSWTASANATYYNVKRSTSVSGPFVTVTNPFSTDKTTGTTFADYNVMNGTTYYYVVSAVNQYGQSANSAVVSAKPVFNLRAPVITSVTDDYYNNVTINWSADYSTESYIFEWAYRFPDGTYGYTTPFGPIYRFGNTFTFSGIQPVNSDIGFRMRGTADASSNYSAFSNFYQFTTNGGPVPRQAPKAPSGLTTSVSTEKATLNWIWDPNGTDPSSTPSYFETFYKAAGGTWSSWGTVDYPGKSYVFTGVTPNTNYQFCVRAVHVDRTTTPYIYYYSRFSPIASVTTTSGLVAPTKLITSITKRGVVDLSWSDNSASRTGYYIERATSASGPFTQVGTTYYPFHQVSGLSDAKQYWFRVRAFCNSVTSAYSNTATSITMSNISTGKTATASSVQSTNPIANGRDNNTSTRWAASSGSVPQWYMIDLGSNKTLGGTEVLWEKSGTGYVYKYRIETSTDKSNWYPAYDNTANTSTAQLQVQEFYGIPAARYVRITITGVPSGMWASFYEFRVFGSEPSMTYEAESSAPSASSAGYNVSSEAENSNSAVIQLSGTPAVGAWLQFTLTNVPAGTYNVNVYFKANTNRGICQGSIDGTNLGGTMDEYSSSAVYQQSFPMGSKTFTAGNHTIRFTVTGKNASSSAYALNIDKIVLTQ